MSYNMNHRSLLLLLSSMSVVSLQLWTVLLFSVVSITEAHPWSGNKILPQSRNSKRYRRSSPHYYEIDDMEQSECQGYNNHSIMGSGREWNIFDSTARGGAGGGTANGREETAANQSRSIPTAESISSSPFSFSRSSSPSSTSTSTLSRASDSVKSSTAGYPRTRSRTRSSSRYASNAYSRSGSSNNKNFNNKSILTNIKEWIQAGNLPKIQCRVEPNTTLKVRKTFRPLKTVVRLGADFNTQLGVWQFKSSWEDDVIGGKLTLAGRELQFSKTWLLSVGAVEDLVTRLRLRAAVDLGTMKAYARLGFRTERLSPINVVEGFTLRKRLPLDGNDGHVKLEVKANFAFPEPEIEYSTEHHRSFVGMGDIEVNIDELNLLLDY